MKRILKNGMVMGCVCAMLVTGCGQQNDADVLNNTEYPETEAAKKTFEGATLIELSDAGILVDGTAVSEDAENAVYAAKDIVYYEEGQDFTYGEGEEGDAHSKEEADAHTVVHITEPGTYELRGSLSAGQIAVDLGEDAEENPEAVVTLILNGVDIECSVAPAVIFYNVYECSDADTENATNTVDTTAAGANVLIADDTINNVTGSYVARIYKPDSVVLNEDGTEVEDAKKLHKYDAAFYSKMTMNINGDEKGTGELNIQAENEGLDSELHLTINGGQISIESGNDGINTNEDGVSVTTVNGGILTIKVTGETGEGDGIDSNGWLVINGGTIVTEACSFSGDAGIDSDMGIHINGGVVMATGNMLDRISESAQNYVVFQFASSQKGGETYILKNEAGEEVLKCTPENDFMYLIFSSDMPAGTYTLWQGETQLAGSAGNRMASGMMGGQRPEGMEIPEGAEIPEGMEIPEGTEMPEGMERPEGMEIPEGMERPEGMEIPEGMEMPEGTERPQGSQRPQNGRGDVGNMGDMEVSAEFEIQDGGNYFSSITIAE